MLEEIVNESAILRLLILGCPNVGSHVSCRHCDLSHIDAGDHGLVKVHRRIVVHRLAFLPTRLHEQLVKDFLRVFDIDNFANHFDDILGESSHLAHYRTLRSRS